MFSSVITNDMLWKAGLSSIIAIVQKRKIIRRCKVCVYDCTVHSTEIFHYRHVVVPGLGFSQVCVVRQLCKECLASQDALEVMRVSHSLTESLTQR